MAIAGSSTPAGGKNVLSDYGTSGYSGRVVLALETHCEIEKVAFS